MMCNSTQFSPREYIARFDDQVDHWYVIDSGQVDFVSHLDADVAYIRYGQGDCFGEVCEPNDQIPLHECMLGGRTLLQLQQCSITH